MTFMATAYCTGTATGTATSAGTPVAEGIVAADPTLLPIGTVIRVTGLSKSYRGDYTVMDTGSRIRGRRLDVYIADCAQAVRFGRRSVGVTVLQSRNHR
jgi:rare lipoprotein A